MFVYFLIDATKISAAETQIRIPTTDARDQSVFSEMPLFLYVVSFVDVYVYPAIALSLWVRKNCDCCNRQNVSYHMLLGRLDLTM